VIAGLKFLGRHAAKVLVVGVFVAALMPGIGAALLPYLMALVIALVTLAMLRTDPAEVTAHMRRPVLLAGLTGIIMIAVPVGTYAIALALQLPADLRLGLLVLTVAPPLASAPQVALFTGLRPGLALNLSVICAILVPFSAPILMAILAGLEFNLDLVAFFLKLAFIVGSALACAVVLRRILGEQRVRRSHEVIDGLGAIFFVLFLFPVLSDFTSRLFEDPWYVVFAFVVVFTAVFALQGVVALICVEAGRALGAPGKSEALTAGLLAGCRNMAMVLAALPVEIAKPLLLVLALQQFPLSFTPMLAGPGYRAWLARKPD
jgi:BASS family bile acid:Na+ symporter